MVDVSVEVRDLDVAMETELGVVDFEIPIY